MQILDFLLIPLSGWLNRVRGGGLEPFPMPGANDFWIAPFYAFAAWWLGLGLSPTASWLCTLLVPYLPSLVILGSIALAPILIAILFGLCWLIEMTPAWGTLYRLWFMEPNPRPGAWYERLFLKLCFGNRTLAFGMRMTVFAIPLAFFFGWQWILIGPAALLSYIVGWSLGVFLHKILKKTAQDPIEGILYSEIIFGLVFGLAMIIAKYGVWFI